MSLFQSLPFTVFIVAFLGIAFIEARELLMLSLVICAGMLAIPFAIIGSLNLLFGRGVAELGR